MDDAWGEHRFFGSYNDYIHVINHNDNIFDIFYEYSSFILYLVR